MNIYLGRKGRSSPRRNGVPPGWQPATVARVPAPAAFCASRNAYVATERNHQIMDLASRMGRCGPTGFDDGGPEAQRSADTAR
jgi:hypothetical protein